MNNWIKPGEDIGAHLTEDSVIVENSENIAVEVNVKSIEFESLDKVPKDLVAKKFINLIGQGYKPGQAAKLVGTTIRGIMSQGQFKKQVQNLVETYNLPADIRRAMVRAGMNQIAIDNLKNPDPSAQKLALDALKSIGSDTEVGINAPPQPGIQINVGNLQGLFTEITDPNIIDVEVIEKEREYNDLAIERKISWSDSDCGTEILDENAIQKLAIETQEENNG